MKFQIGCNYWGSKYGIDMWKYWDAESVGADLAALARYGVKCLRVFPNWREFQPIHAQRAWRNQLRDFSFADDKPIDNEFGLDMTCIANFRSFARMAEENGMDLVVSIVTGWMSGRLYAPPALENCNHISDPLSLMWQTRLARGLVRYFKDIPNITAWDLGNECNNLAEAKSREEAYLWAATIRNAILSEDHTRPIMSGMHFLRVHFREPWTIQDQGELTDILSPHPYPSPSVGGDVDPMNKLRTTLIPSAQCALYTGVGKKPCMIQETGTFNQIVGNEETKAAFMRATLWSGFANGAVGYLWWCGHDLGHLMVPPYAWSMNETELGLLNEDLTPKGVALQLKELSDAIASLPFEQLPPALTDAVCIVPDTPDNFYHVTNSAYVLGKQAGLNLTFAELNQQIPKAPMYIVPSLRGWSPIAQTTLHSILAEVERGAVALFSTATGFITGIETIFGLESHGMANDGTWRTADFGAFKLPFFYDKKFLLTSCGAEVLSADADGTVICSRNKYGEGWIYFLNFGIEIQSWNIPDSYNKDPYYRVYQLAAASILEKKPIVSNNPSIALTLHPLCDGEMLVTAINYSDSPLPLDVTLRGVQISEVFYGDASMVPACSATIFKLKKAG